MDSESEWLFMAPHWLSQHWWEEPCQGKSCGTKEDFGCMNDGKVEGETGSALLPSKQNFSFHQNKTSIRPASLWQRGQDDTLGWSPRPWAGGAFGGRIHVGQDQEDMTNVWWESKNSSYLLTRDKGFYELILVNNDLLLKADCQPASLFNFPPLLILEFKHAS